MRRSSQNRSGRPVFAAILLLAQPALPATPQTTPSQTATFSTTANVVIVNVTVLSHDGKPLDNLTKDDFLLFEDGKQQPLQSVDLQRLDTRVLAPLEPQFATRSNSGSPDGKTAQPAPKLDSASLQDHRLMILLFDLSSMQPAEQVRAVEAATRFLSTQMTSSDLVAIMTFGSNLQTVQDFTADRDLLVQTLRKFHIGESSELAGMADTGADAEDQSGQYVADETEFNIFNTDRKLAALEDAARKLSVYPQKKALVYFSSGVEKTGVDNQSQLRATVNTAVKANVAFYPIDARGLTARVPGGDASQAGAVGSNLYSGAGQRAQRDTFQNQQETLYSLAADTGGKALLDSNDPTIGMTQVQKDISSYYTLAYASSNPAEDGRYRRIQVKLAPKWASLKAKLDYRPGYFAPTTFAKMSGSDKEARLQQALESENPLTDLPLAVEVDYFRLERAKYFVPVTVRIPGSALSFRNKGSKSATELDFIGEVRDAKNRPASAVRDTIPLKLDEAKAGEVGRKQIQYDTGFTLGPGKYTLRFVARENGEGKVGTFESRFTVPDLGSGSVLRISSVILSNQREALRSQIAGAKNDMKLLAQNPLIDTAGNKIVPNVTRVFRPGQSLSAYLEVYDPSIPENLPPGMKLASVSASLGIYDGTHKLTETPAVRINRLDAKRPDVVALNLSTNMASLKPGKYICQVNVVDEFGKKFAFSRTAMVLLPKEDAPN